MNKFLCLALLFVATFAAEYTREEGVYVLTESNFNDALNEFDFVLVEFYAPWCGHCKRLAPEYAAAAQQLETSHPNVKLAKVDSTVERDLASRFGVQGYPTLKFFIKGNSGPVEYEGGRTTPEIISWLVKKSGPVTTEVKSASEVETIRSGNDVVGFFLGSASSSAFVDFKTVGASNDDVYFIHSHDDAIRNEFGVEENTLILFKKFDEGKNVFTGPWSFDAVKDFINAHKFPVLLPFTQKAAQRIFGEGLDAFFLLVSDNEAGKAAEAQFKAVAESLKGKIVLSVAVITESMGQRLAEYIGITEKDVPTLRIVQPGQGMLKFAFEGEVTEKSARDFYDDWSNGRLRPFFKSEPIPESNSEPVKVLVGKSFKDIVINSEDDVLVEFYAPWCGHCKQLTPIYDALATKLKDVQGLVIAKIDSTANEVEGIEVRGFPTIKFFAKGKKNAPVDFEGDRTEEGFIQYLKQHSTAYANHTPKAPTDNEL